MTHDGRCYRGAGEACSGSSLACVDPQPHLVPWKLVAVTAHHPLSPLDPVGPTAQTTPTGVGRACRPCVCCRNHSKLKGQLTVAQQPQVGAKGQRPSDMSYMFNMGAGKEGEKDEGGPQMGRRPTSSTRFLDGSTEFTRPVSANSPNKELDVEADQLLAYGLKVQMDHKVGTKLKAPNTSKASIHNYFTRARSGVRESTKLMSDYDTRTAPPKAILELHQPTMPTQTEQAQGPTSCATGSSLDASTIGELIELADTASGESRSSHFIDLYNRSSMIISPTGTDSGTEDSRIVPMAHDSLAVEQGGRLNFQVRINCQLRQRSIR
ncbi:hypothetical protein NDU88_003442 [Pleurodeles waltl]|uniref:Uncharacterized protein n=1 Tax=Pleurodeles waltl TaxID=8319 RepID=A0AAV7M715_PLEWA|nr:hypothetical protein NDU88_003442 [Pleurodeles waltl]